MSKKLAKILRRPPAMRPFRCTKWFNKLIMAIRIYPLGINLERKAKKETA